MSAAAATEADDAAHPDDADAEVTLDLVGIDGLRRPMHEPHECPECEGPYVMDDGEKVCHDCGLLSGVADDTDDSDPHKEWLEHRHEDDEIEGWYGEDRIRFPGGFSHPYFIDDTENAYLDLAD